MRVSASTLTTALAGQTGRSPLTNGRGDSTGEDGSGNDRGSVNVRYRATRGRARYAAAGAAAAAVWALQEPLDQRLIGCDYSDVAVLGKAFTSDRAWWPMGFAAHLANGALFGLAYHEVCRRWPARPRTLGVGLALGEHVALYPLCFFVDRFHPRRGAPGVPPLLKNHKAFMQATWRHAVFGLVLVRLASRPA